MGLIPDVDLRSAGIEPDVPVAVLGGARLRIAMVAACPFPYPRGTPVRICRLAEALARRGHEVHVVTYHLGETDPGLPFHVHRIPAVKHYRTATPGPTWGKLLVLDPLLLRTLRGVLRDHRFDLIHAHHYEGLLVARGVPARLRPPVIYDAHTLLRTELPFYRLGIGGPLLRYTGRLLDRHLPGRAGHVIAVTETLRDRLVESGAVRADAITVIESGVEVEMFDVPPAPKRGPGKTVVFAGNTAAYQGLEYLLRAFGLVLERRRDARLVIITDAELGAYAKLAGALGIGPHLDVLRVPFDGLPPHLRAADVAVNPRTECEGLPQKLMNYMASGCPIVSFAGSAAQLRHGESGWIVADGDVAGMADGINRLLDDPALARRLGDTARDVVTRHYSWDRAARKTEEVYARVLGTSHAPA